MWDYASSSDDTGRHHGCRRRHSIRQAPPPEPKRPKPEPKPRAPEAKRRARNGYEYTREQFVRILGEDLGELEWEEAGTRALAAQREGRIPGLHDTEEDDVYYF